MVCVEVLLHLSDTPQAAQRCVLTSLGARVSTAGQAMLGVHRAVTSLLLRDT